MEKYLKKIEAKLDVIVKLLCTKCVEGKSTTEAILALEGVGVSREFISELTGSSQPSIRTIVSNAKKRNEKAKAKRKGKEEKNNGQAAA